jgi:hypothetical protein
MKMSQLESWIDAYILAWAANDAKAIGDLFTEKARYYTHPFRDPWVGRDEIVRGWLDQPDAPGSWSADYGPVAVYHNTGVIRGKTTYFNPDRSISAEYANVYVIEFDDDGRANEFTEFFMEANPQPRDAPPG